MATYDAYAAVSLLFFCLTQVPVVVLYIALAVYCFKGRKWTGTEYRYKLNFVYRLMLKAMFLGLEVRSVPEDQILPLDPEDPAIEVESNSTGISADTGTLTDTGSSTGIETIADTGTTTDTETPTDAETLAEDGIPADTVTLITDSTNIGRMTLRSRDNGTHIDRRAFRDEHFEVHLHNNQLRRLTSYGLVLVVAFVLSYSTYTLLRVLIIEENSTCGEEGYDCFLDRQKISADCTTVNNGTAVQMNGTDDSLVCFRFTYNYIMAFGAAGGVVISAEIIINSLVVLIVSPSKIRNALCRVLMIVLYLAFLAVLTILGLYGAFSSPATTSRAIEIWTYTSILNMSSVVPLLLIRDIYSKAAKKKRGHSLTGI